jgi:threonine synthase
MPAFLGYRCHRCGRSYPPADVFYTCPEDGANLDVVIDLARIRSTSSPEAISASKEYSIWRYLPLLPVGEPGHRGTPLWDVGWTPLFRPESSRCQAGSDRPVDQRRRSEPDPSAEIEASAVVVAQAQEIGAKVVVTIPPATRCRVSRDGCRRLLPVR